MTIRTRTRHICAQSPRRLRILPALSLILWLPTLANASLYDDCVLKHMRGVTSDAAARSIQTACLHTSERDIPQNILTVLRSGSRAGFDKQQGLFLQVKNNTAYTITKLLVRITEKDTSAANDYVLDYFEPAAVALGGAIMTDPYAPEFHSIQPGQRYTFRVNITERAESLEDFSQKYVWNIVRAWGFLDDPGTPK